MVLSTEWPRKRTTVTLNVEVEIPPRGHGSERTPGEVADDYARSLIGSGSSGSYGSIRIISVKNRKKKGTNDPK